MRLHEYDYSWPGWYYVTVCTYLTECTLGEIIEGAVRLTRVGRIVEEEWLRTPELRSNVELDAYVIMPNHLHGIIIIHDEQRRSSKQDYSVRTHSRASLQKLKFYLKIDTTGRQIDKLVHKLYGLTEEGEGLRRGGDNIKPPSFRRDAPPCVPTRIQNLLED